VYLKGSRNVAKEEKSAKRNDMTEEKRQTINLFVHVLPAGHGTYTPAF